jgi:flagellar basal body rod protein FlgG
MNVSLYQAAAAMNAHARWQELITENLSMASVPGFRKQNVSFAAVEAGLNASAAGTNAPRHVIPSALSTTSFQPGEVRATGDQMDFAIDGPGFFEVRLPNGSLAYTRDGEFHLNAGGQIVTKQGYAVLGENGPTPLDLNNPSPITVSSSGEVSQAGEFKGRMLLVEFNDPRSLTPIGGGYFLPGKATAVPPDSVTSSIRQGVLEASNTSSVMEMSDLIVAMRLFEANQRVLQMQDERMGRVISELGNPS